MEFISIEILTSHQELSTGYNIAASLIQNVKATADL